MSQPLKLGIAGLGTVGAGLLQLLQAARRPARADARAARIEVAGVCARARTKKRGVALDGIKWFDDPERAGRATRRSMCSSS